MAEQANGNGTAGRRQSAQMSGLRKAAVLLVAVGEEPAKEILRALPEADVQRITEELADLRGITSELSAEIIEELRAVPKIRSDLNRFPMFALVFTAALALLAGILIGLVVLSRREPGDRRGVGVPFGPSLALGGLVALFAGHAMIAAYLHLLG